MKRTLLTGVRKWFNFVYDGLIKLNKPSKKHLANPNDKVETMLYAFNKCMRRIYRRPELQITDRENIDLFRTYTDDGLRINGLIYRPHKESKKYVIASHWFAGNKFWSLYHAASFVKMGYNVICYDFRGHGFSDQDSCTMGAKEIRDLMAVLEWTKDNVEYDHLALTGTSMGGFVTNYASILYGDKLKDYYKVKFAISDVSYGSLQSLLMHVGNVHLIMPKRKTKRNVNVIMNSHNKFESLHGVNFYDVDIFKLIENGKRPTYPIFFTHSKDDKVTSPFDSYRLAYMRSKFIEGDDIRIYNYCMHTQLLRVHFKSFVKNQCSFIARMDDNQADYDKVVKEWKLDIVEKKDKKSNALK